MQPSVEAYLDEVLITEAEIQARIAALGKQISQDYVGKNLLLVGILKGSVLFLTDLMRQLTVSPEIDFLAISSYDKGGRETTGAVKLLKDLDDPIEGKHVLIVEDIIDSGFTLQYLSRLLKPRNPASLKMCVLLSKPARREADIAVDYVGFDIEDRFVFGYGLDIDELFRELPYIAITKVDV